MRNVTIVLAVLAMATVAYGDVTATWTGSGNFDTPANWSTGATPYLGAPSPAADGGRGVGAGETCTVTKAMDLQNFMIEGGAGGLTAGELYVNRGLQVGYQNYTGTSTFTQTGGIVVVHPANRIFVGGSVRGSGTYTISGGSIGGGSNGRGANLQVGANRPSKSGEDVTGKFVIDESGTTTPGSIVVGIYTQIKSTKATGTPAAPTLKVVLSAVGYVTPIEVTGADWYDGATLVQAADLEGVLSVDGSNYTNMGAEVITVDILKVTGSGNLDYAGLALDAASTAAGWTLGDNGAGTLQVSNVPEPATMVLLGIGGIGVLIRRRRK